MNPASLFYPALLIAILGIPPPTNPRLEAVLTSSQVAALKEPGQVSAFRVDNFLPPGPTPPPGVVSFGLPGAFRLRPESKALQGADAASLKAVLLRRSSYASYVTTCMFEPGIAFAIPSKSDLLVLVCFKCSEVAFVKGRKRLETFSLTGAGKQALWTISSKLYPELQQVQPQATEQ